MKLQRYNFDCDGCTCGDNEGEFCLVEDVEPLIEINKEMLEVLKEVHEILRLEFTGVKFNKLNLVIAKANEQ